MQVIKRDGTIVEYNSEKINIAIEKANKEVSKKEKATLDIFCNDADCDFSGILIYV